MKDKPKELTGAAKPFINVILPIVQSIYNVGLEGIEEVGAANYDHKIIEARRNVIDEMLKYVEIETFLSQKFEPDMIEYFEDISFDEKNMNYCTKEGIEIYYEDWDDFARIQFYFPETRSTWTNFFIRTINDFITACNNSGIKLMYKED